MMNSEMNRRRFVKGTVLASAGAAMAVGRAGLGGETPAAAAGASQTAAAPPAPQNTLSKGKIGKLEISRLILGGNLLTHYTHSRDLSYVYNLAAHYNTDEKILETLAVAEANGVDTVSMHNPPHPISLLRRYRKERGGKIKWIICPTAPVEKGLGQYRQQVEELVKDGVEAIYLWGVHSDALIGQGKVDLIQAAVELPKEYGLPSGVGGHSLEVVKACEQHGVKADFYIKTFHHHNYPSAPKPDQLQGPYNEVPGYWDRNPQETAEFMQSVGKPWIAFKTMAAGAIPPRNAFRFAFSKGADFVLAGMFDYEIAEDVKIIQESLASVAQRGRPWQG